MQKGMSELVQAVSEAIMAESLKPERHNTGTIYMNITPPASFRLAHAAIKAIEKFQKENRTIVVPMGNIPR